MLKMHWKHAHLAMLPQKDSNGLGDHFSQSKTYHEPQGTDIFDLYKEHGIAK